MSGSSRAKTPGTASRAPALEGHVSVRGAREHNLKGVDVDIPRNALVVFTGVSGSGKSSLAFGTIYAEAQRRYFDSVAPYARRLLDQVGVPDVDAIDGLPPAVALQQQRGTPSPRSSVGSVTTLSSFLRMLYSRAGNYPPEQPMLYAEDFSPNTPQGACPHCHGLGKVYEVTERSMVPDDSLTIRERAIAAWPPAWHGQNLRDILVTLGYNVDTPWRDLPQEDRDWILYTDEQPTVPVYAGLTPSQTKMALRRKQEPSYQGTFTGVRRYVLNTFATTQSALMKRRVSRFMVGSLCPLCSGKRLNQAALSVTFAGVDIGTLSQWSLDRVAELLGHAARGVFEGGGTAHRQTLSRQAARQDTQRRVAEGGSAHTASTNVRFTPNLSPEKRLAAQRIAQDLLERIGTLQALGLGYLSLDRSTPTLSPGELQRLRLATQIRSNLFGVVYVLDEPSAGLHPADSEALFRALVQLKTSGNSVFVVEHDVEMMQRADWLVDVGPEAGSQGGELLYSGPPEGLRHVKTSTTARYLFAKGHEHQPLRRQPTGWLDLRDISRNNLKALDVRFPLGVITAVTGVSGSGKSSLVSQALVELVGRHLGYEPSMADDEGDELEPNLLVQTGGYIKSGAESIRRLVQVDQKPIGRTPRSNLATYTGLFDVVRKLFAATKAARAKRYDAGRFSFNVPKGRCETCEGDGVVSVELLFMPNVSAPCPTCHGARYNPQTLAVTWNGKNIAQVLDLTVDEAHDFFAGEPALLKIFTLLQQIGLGYLRLGQPATELSGGEAQRVKLATELQRTQRGSSLYVFDEPSTGLHPSDVDKLMSQLNGLVDNGNTVVVVEHDMRVVAGCDWVIDVGPGAGEAGGLIVASGSPEEVSQATDSLTAAYLRTSLKGQAIATGQAPRVGGLAP